jgi:carbon-monoxide dehydrogenase large subunit
VHLVLTAERMEAAGVLLGMDGTVITDEDGRKGANPERPVLARTHIRHVGEPVAMVVADTNEEAANLLALQTRQQLSSTALSMASQADQAVLRLF